MVDQRFEPKTIRVEVGETVTFVNKSKEAHTVTAYDDGVPAGADYFASGGLSSERAARQSLTEGLLDEGASYSVTFDEPGTYRYFCIPHEDQGMTGTVVVET